MIDIEKLIKEDPKNAVEYISALAPDSDAQACRDEYDNKRTRRPESVGNRQDKVIGGEKIINESTGKEETTPQSVVKVSKLAIPFPKKIVRIAVSFLIGKPLTISHTDESDSNVLFDELWTDDLMMDSLLRKFARCLFVEKKTAIIFYPASENNAATIETRLLKESKDGLFYQLKDNKKKVQAFVWQTTIKNEELKDINVMYVYTNDYIFTLKQDGGTYILESQVINLFKTIPVVYQDQELTEWDDIASMMDSFEMRMSKLIDTNDYFSSPTVVSKGNVVDAPGKQEVGKWIDIDPDIDSDGKANYGDVDYLTWDQTPESQKMELNILKDFIYSLSSTPDLSFESVKGIGNISGITIQMMFIDAMLKAYEKREDFNVTVKNCIKVISAGMNNIMSGNVDSKKIRFKYNSALPSNDSEVIEMLTDAVSGKSIMSQETAVKHNPFVTDAKAENEKIEEEAKAETNRINESFE